MVNSELRVPVRSARQVLEGAAAVAVAVVVAHQLAGRVGLIRAVVRQPEPDVVVESRLVWCRMEYRLFQ